MYFCDGKISNCTAYVEKRVERSLPPPSSSSSPVLCNRMVRSPVPFSNELTVHRDVLPFPAVIRRLVGSTAAARRLSGRERTPGLSITGWRALVCEVHDARSSPNDCTYVSRVPPSAS